MIGLPIPGSQTPLVGLLISIALARYAERSIDLQYYLYHEDMVGALLLDQLLRAAERGVRVRMLIDEMDLDARVRSKRIQRSA